MELEENTRSSVTSSSSVNTLDPLSSLKAVAAGHTSVDLVPRPASPDGLFEATSWWEPGELNFVTL